MSALHLCDDCDRYQPKGVLVTCKFCGGSVRREPQPDDNWPDDE